jgi:hypothetical protein
MRTPLFALAAGISIFAGLPALALTVSSAPPKPDVALRLKPSGSTPGAVRFEDTWAGGGRPANRSSFSGGPSYRSTQTFGFGGVTTTIRSGPARGAWDDPRWTDRRRETAPPLSLSPLRR